MQGAWVWSLVRELSYPTCHAVWLKKKKTPNPTEPQICYRLKPIVKKAVLTSPPFILLYSMQILFVGFVFLESFFPCPLVSLVNAK